jgi:NAD(P)-dependent dehydrogenase (short-subunit alcohol dehydrogenase family)
MASLADPMLAGRTALVTGASRGIGFAIARRLVEAGARVAMIARDAATLSAAAGRAGGAAVAADVTDRGTVEALPARIEAATGSPVPDFIVNAAGSFRLGALAELDATEFDRQIDANLRAPYLVIRTFLPLMLERGSGHIVTIGSVAGRVAMAGNGAYSASKFGIRGLHAVLALELKGTGVRSTLVEPAATDTPLWDSIDRSVHANLPPKEAMLQPDDVADAVLYALTRPARAGISNLALERT